MTLDFTRSAEEDLREISDYTRDTWGEVRQDNYLRQLYKKFQQMVENPDRWKFREDLFSKCQIARCSNSSRRHGLAQACPG